MNQVAPIKKEPPRSVLITMAKKYNMEPSAFEQTLRATVVPHNTSREQFAAFLVVANEYGLNPLTKEIYAFPARNGGIQPIVSIDGWCNLINSHPMCNGIEFDDHLDENGRVTSITARIWRKDRDKPIIVTEYMAECHRPTEPWQKWPRRMLRHKALIQCARYAFGFAGIVDPDEAERMGAGNSAPRDVTPPARDAGPPLPQQPQPQDRDVELVTGGLDNGDVVEWTDSPQVTAEETTSAPRTQTTDPEAILQWIEAKCAACTDGAELENFWNDRIAPRLDELFPPDREEAMGIHRKHERRLAP
jgi:phage recombination protein Bet